MENNDLLWAECLASLGSYREYYEDLPTQFLPAPPSTPPPKSAPQTMTKAAQPSSRGTAALERTPTTVTTMASTVVSDLSFTPPFIAEESRNSSLLSPLPRWCRADRRAVSWKAKEEEEMPVTRVAVRLRPPRTQKQQQVQQQSFRVLNSSTLQLQLGELRTAYRLDHVIDCQESNEESYQHVARSIVCSYHKNSAIVSYGAKASGKTYTLQGQGQREPGWIALAAADLLRQQEPGHETDHDDDCCPLSMQLTVQYFEIDSDTDEVRDLLFLPAAEDPLLLRVDEDQVVVNAYEEPVESVQDVLELLHRGNARRSAHGHTIFRFQRCGRSTASIVDFVDLATADAEEDDSFARTVRALSLPDCQRPLDWNEESKLSQILQHNLLGRAPLAIVCCLSPHKIAASKATLKFAASATRMHKVDNSVDNQEESMVTIRKLREELAATKRELEVLRKQERRNTENRDCGSVSSAEAITGPESEVHESVRSFLTSAATNDVPPPIAEVIIHACVCDAASTIQTETEFSKILSLERELMSSRVIAKPLFQNLKDVKARHCQLERLNKDAVAKEDIELMLLHSKFLHAALLASLLFLCHGQTEQFVACVIFAWATFEVIASG